jgi:hypothetical protein
MNAQPSDPMGLFAEAILAAQLGDAPQVKRQLGELFDCASDREQLGAVRDIVAMSLGSALPLLSQSAQELLDNHIRQLAQEETAISTEIAVLESQFTDLASDIERIGIAVELSQLADNEAVALFARMQQLEHKVRSKLSQKDKALQDLRTRLESARGRDRQA